MGHYQHYYQGTDWHSLLHVEMITEDRMNIKLQGDPVIATKMIRTAMDTRQDIAAAMIAAVLHWAKDKNINCGDLEKMVQFHK